MDLKNTYGVKWTGPGDRYGGGVRRRVKSDFQALSHLAPPLKDLGVVTPRQQRLKLVYFGAFPSG